MAGSVFRKKSMDRVSSPEQLNDYIKVSNPAVWMIICAIIILLIGICVWGIFGRLDTVIKGGAYCKGGIVQCYLNENDFAKLIKNQQTAKVKVDGKSYPIASISQVPEELDEEDFEHPEGNDRFWAMHKSGLKDNDWAFSFFVNAPLKDGVYDTNIEVESVSPMSFILS